MLIYAGGSMVAAKTSEWLQILSAGSSHYVLICGAVGNTWAEQGISPHCIPTNSLMEQEQKGVTGKDGRQALGRLPDTTAFVPPL